MNSLFVNTLRYDSIMVKELGLVMHAMQYSVTAQEAGHPQKELPYMSSKTSSPGSNYTL